MTRTEHRTLFPFMCFICTQWTGNILKPSQFACYMLLVAFNFLYQQLQELTYSPCDQTFQIPLYVGHLVDVLQLHSRYTTVVFSNSCIRSPASTASKKLSKTSFLFHHFLGQPLLVRCHGCTGPARLQGSKILRRHVKTAAMIMHLKRRGGFTETKEIS